ncbi:putative phospholipase B-like lamina ancestor isoform X2 [Bicyclus anynana]|uniref:Phospholipase B-like n=1 Tax=Bicyclus anynana TaxID=110368 RepID=A0A6J1MK86_BICAN|nr:putative phospholipase B-like lamina ancestor isoform X2 [Bicyclus anynana]
MSKILKVVGASWMQTKISSYILGFLGVLAILALFVGQIERWSLLEIETDGSYPDEIQAYAAGIVEGALTWYLIHTHLENTIRAKCEDQPIEKQCDKLRDTLDKSVNIWKTYAAERAATDPFWHHVALHYTQIGGIYTGWNHGVVRSNNEYETDISDLYWLNSVAEVVEIQHKLNISVQETEFSSMPGLSSAFLRIANETSEDGEDIKKLFLAQDVAGSYSSMTRILKRYKLNYHKTSKDTDSAPGATVEFAGYPGSITSQDEFYIARGDNHRLAITGTALRNYNDKLWKNVNITEQVPLGPRITAANHLASNVSSWGHTLARSNSGTGCKQWLVVDYNKFNQLQDSAEYVAHKIEKKEIVTESKVNNDIKHTIVHRAGSGRAKGLLWLIEQVPGRTHSADISDAFLEKTYWATYGLPFFIDIANITHVTKMEEEHGNIFSESESPRAVIFRNGHKNATTVKSIFQLMRSNNLSTINNTSEINCKDGKNCFTQKAEYLSGLGYRGDIVKENKKPYGIIDTKIISGSIGDTSLDFIAISSPPFTEPAKLNITKVNKGNVASTYTNQFDDVPMINGLEIRDLVKHQQEEAERGSLEILNKDVIKPFSWSESDFKEEPHEGLPDLWNFGPFRPVWSW